MAGITDLKVLLAGMKPILSDNSYVFVTCPDAAYGDRAGLDPIGSFREAEGLTLIVPRQNADTAGIAYDGGYRKITLQIHSSLAAVGLTAAVAGALAQSGISANVVAAYFHDHIFVPEEKAASALKTLEKLQLEAELNP